MNEAVDAAARSPYLVAERVRRGAGEAWSPTNALPDLTLTVQPGLRLTAAMRMRFPIAAAGQRRPLEIRPGFPSLDRLG